MNKYHYLNIQITDNSNCMHLQTVTFIVKNLHICSMATISSIQHRTSFIKFL